MKSIIELARKAGIDVDTAWGVTDAAVKRFAALVRAAALEEAADVVDNADTPDCGGWTANGIADAIRALKEKP